jgi:hypothetical protein
MFKLPFGWLPGHIGLVGKTREIAKAEYELEGYDLHARILEIRKDELSEDEYNQKLLDLKLTWKKITDSEYKRSLIDLIKDETQRSIASLELDLKEGKIKELDYNKRLATLKGEPWVTVINMDFTKGSSLEGSFELDWNEFFVEKLKKEGYNAINSEAIVNMWFMELCRNIALEEFDGTGNFTSDSEANLETFKRWNSSTEELDKGRRGYR